jgi:hypothetical protein
MVALGRRVVSELGIRAGHQDIRTLSGKGGTSCAGRLAPACLVILNLESDSSPHIHGSDFLIEAYQSRTAAKQRALALARSRVCEQ